MKNKILTMVIIVALLQGISAIYLLTFYGVDTYWDVHFACMKILSVCYVVALVPAWFKREQIKQYIKSLK